MCSHRCALNSFHVTTSSPPRQNAWPGLPLTVLLLASSVLSLDHLEPDKLSASKWTVRPVFFFLRTFIRYLRVWPLPVRHIRKKGKEVCSLRKYVMGNAVPSKVNGGVGGWSQASTSHPSPASPKAESCEPARVPQFLRPLAVWARWNSAHTSVPGKAVSLYATVTVQAKGLSKPEWRGRPFSTQRPGVPNRCTKHPRRASKEPDGNRTCQK